VCSSRGSGAGRGRRGRWTPTDHSSLSWCVRFCSVACVWRVWCVWCVDLVLLAVAAVVSIGTNLSRWHPGRSHTRLRRRRRRRRRRRAAHECQEVMAEVCNWDLANFTSEDGCLSCIGSAEKQMHEGDSLRRLIEMIDRSIGSTVPKLTTYRAADASISLWL
jgi:hypothetical protein